MKRLVLLVVLCLMVGGASAAYGNYTSFTYNITAGAGAQTNYQVKFILSNASGVSGYYAPDSAGNNGNIIFTNGTTRVDWFDVNVTDGAGSPVPFWIENNTQTAKNCTAWVNVPTIAVGNTSTGRWYYGDASQTTSTMNGMTTFPFFDDFSEASLNSTQWASTIASGGSATVSGGEMKLISSTTTVDLRSYLVGTTYNTTPNTTVETRTKVNGHLNVGAIDSIPSFRDAVILSYISWLDLTHFSSNQIKATTSTAATDGSYDSGYHIWSIKRNGTTSVGFQRDRASAFSNAMTNVPTVSMAAGIDCVSDYPKLTNATMDWYFIRSSVFAEPFTSNYSTTSGVVVSPISASFTQSVNPSSVGQPVNFTDTSTGTPVTWNWTIAGTITNTTQNAAYTFTTAGTYYVNLSVTNATGSSSVANQTHTVTNATVLTPQDIWMEGQYLQTFHITDSSTGLPIPVVQLQDTAMQTYTTTNGTGYLTEAFGASNVVFISSGYSSKSISYVFDSDETHDVQLTPATSGGTKTTFYIPQQVRIKLIDQNNKYLNGVSMTATPLNFTAPDNWTQVLIGIDPSVNMQGTTLLGTTASDGSWAAPMLASFEYQFTITDASRSINMNFSTYPSQTEFVWMIPVGFSAIQTPSNIITYSLGNVTINQTREFINMSYADSTSGTTYLQFAVFNVSGVMVYSTNYTGAANCANQIYSQEITHGTAGSDAFTYGIFASQSQYGWINHTQTVTFSNQIALIGEAPGWVEYWLSVGLIIIMGASFGLLARRFALIVVSLLAWFLQFWMGWFDVGAPGAVLFGFMLALGVLIYIRESENKLS